MNRETEEQKVLEHYRKWSLDYLERKKREILAENVLVRKSALPVGSVRQWGKNLVKKIAAKDWIIILSPPKKASPETDRRNGKGIKDAKTAHDLFNVWDANKGLFWDKKKKKFEPEFYELKDMFLKKNYFFYKKYQSDGAYDGRQI